MEDKIIKILEQINGETSNIEFTDVEKYYSVKKIGTVNNIEFIEYTFNIDN